MSWFKGLALKPIAVAIIITFFIAISLPAKGFASNNINADGPAGIKSSQSKTFNFSRSVDSRIVSDQLKTLGLSDDDISRRLDKLSDAQLHQFATNNSEIYPGGSIIGSIILTAIILAAAYAYIKYTGKRVVIE